MVTSSTIYLLDSNVFIEAKNRYYAFDIVPPFWEALKQHSASGQIQSIDRIRKELLAGKDELAEWLKQGNMDDAFKSTDDPVVVTAYQEIMNWVQSNQQLRPSAKQEFANNPDGWLVAYAKSKGSSSVVVTHEAYRPEAQGRVLIPNICVQFGIVYHNTFEMLRALAVKLGG